MTNIWFIYVEMFPPTDKHTFLEIRREITHTYGDLFKLKERPGSEIPSAILKSNLLEK